MSENQSDWLRKMASKQKKWDANSHNRGKVRVEVYRVDAILLRKGWRPKCAGTKTRRSKIGNTMSIRSRRNLVFTLNNCTPRMRSMLTLTMSPLCHELCPPRVHKHALKLALQRLRDKGIEDYVWVREFQKNGSVHWHIFTSFRAGESGEVNEELSSDWSRWWSDLYWKKLITPATLPEASKRHKLSEWHMRHGNGGDFLGSCRFEELVTEAAGRYAAKEGSKTIQKLMPMTWFDSGGAWWRQSKSLTCEPICEEWINSSMLEVTEVEIKGKAESVAYKLQQNLGMKILSSKNK